MAARKKEPQAAATTEQLRPERPQQPPFFMEGRTLEKTFTELEHEGKACLYELLRAAVGKMPRTFFSEKRRSWNGDLNDERKDLLNGFLRDGGTAVYGSTFLRAKARWDAEVRTAPPRQLSEEERRYVIDVPPDPSTPTAPGGTIYIGAAPERGSTVPLENLFTYWIEEFTAEVEKAVEAFSENPNTSAELQRITSTLRSFKVGKRGKLIRKPMQADAAGKDLLAKFEHAKSRLAARLEEVDTEHANGTVPLSTTPLFTWKGSPAELFVLFEELVGKGWVEIPKNRGKRSRDQLARNIHGAFQFSAGTALKVGSAVNYMKKGRDGVNEQRPEPRVVFALKRNPDVGEEYDPDKAGE